MSFCRKFAKFSIDFLKGKCYSNHATPYSFDITDIVCPLGYSAVMSDIVSQQFGEGFLGCRLLIEATFFISAQK